MICKALTAVGVPIVLFILLECNAARRWDYEPINIEGFTSDPKKLAIDLKIQQTRKGENFFAGYLTFNYEIDETTMVEATAMRSQSGNDDDYKPVPWSIPKQPYTEFIASFYEDMIYKNAADCSNFPPPADVLPWKQINYTFTECIFKGDGMPEIAPQGYYKIHFLVTGEVEWGFESVCKIFDKLVP